MYKKELGFVLKRFLPNKNKISVLSQNLGKIEIITRPAEKIFQLWPGMLIYFYLDKQMGKVFFVQNLEIMMSPYYDNVLDMEWIHQHLEICYYFLQPQDPAKEVFGHLYNSFNISILNQYFKDELFVIKKIYIIKLLELLGFYPERDLIVYLGLYIDLTSMYINFVDKDKVKLLKNNLQKVKREHILKINNWIRQSLAIHSNFRFFKIVNIKENF
ncbi:MAG: hypothetical protein ABIF12_00450 [bacterium]